ncbi:MAG: hypothetical protein ACK4S4_04880 [Pyrinomonadaceae bacterium]
MKKFLLVIAAFILPLSVAAQGPATAGASIPNTAARTTDTANAVDLARAVFSAHGGEKLQKMKSLIVRGSVDLSAFGQAFPGSFSLVIAQERYRIEVNSIQSFKQAFDGENTVTSVQAGFMLPPMNRLGIPLLARFGETGYVVSELPSGKKRSGFRITSPEGWYTDFYIDEKTKLVKSYDSAFEFRGQKVSTSVDIGKNATVDGVVVPDKFAQRFDMGQITAYVDFKAKEILVNAPVADEVFKNVN